MKQLIAILAFVGVLLATDSEAADNFGPPDLKKTWVFVGAGNGVIDEFGDPVACVFSCTVRIGQDLVVYGNSCKIRFAGETGDTTFPIVDGLAEILSQKYARWKITFTADLPTGPLVFQSLNRAEFVYDVWDPNDDTGIALGPFSHGASRFEADNGMVGLWAWKISKPFEIDP